MTEAAPKLRGSQKPRFKRAPLQLKDGLDKRLSSYMLSAGGMLKDVLAKPGSTGWVVAGATGVGMLAMSAPASADIVKGTDLVCCTVLVSSRRANPYLPFFYHRSGALGCQRGWYSRF